MSEVSISMTIDALNALIKKYGYPEDIVIEMPRDRNDAEQKDRIKNFTYGIWRNSDSEDRWGRNKEASSCDGRERNQLYWFARGYTVSERYIGYGLEGIRDKFVLATKSMARTKEAMAADIETSSE